MIIAGGAGFLPFSASLFLYVWGVTTLKDLSDFKGDFLAGRNVKKTPGMGKTYTMSAVLMILSIAGFLMTPFKIVVIMPVSALFVLFLSCFFLKHDFNGKIYKRMILVSGITAIISLIFSLFSLN